MPRKTNTIKDPVLNPNPVVNDSANDKVVINTNVNTNANSKEGFSNISTNTFHSTMPNVGKNTNIEYARRQFDAINGTQRRHV